MHLSPPGSFKRLPNLMTIGIGNIDKAIKNLQEGAERSKHALKNGCFIEVISLRIQHIEFWLRFFWVAKNQKGQIYSSSDKRTFGKIIAECEKMGFKSELIMQLKKFNSDRVNAIHRYLLGAIEYNQLEQVCSDSTGLDAIVREYVTKEIGIPV